MSKELVRDSLRRLRVATDLSILKAVVEPLQERIDMINSFIVATNHEPKADDYELDEEDRQIDEALIGVGFVACQASITHVASRAVEVASGSKDAGFGVLSTWKKKDDVFALAEPWKPGGATKIQVVNATANYFKHRDEWPDADWATLAAQTAGNGKLRSATITIILQVGASSGSQSNLRTASGALDGDLIGAVEVWATGVLKHAEKELDPHL